MEEKFYVYFHVNPKTRVVFYVGKGHGIKQVAELLDRPIYWVRDRFNGRLKDVFNITNRYNIV